MARIAPITVLLLHLTACASAEPAKERAPWWSDCGRADLPASSCGTIERDAAIAQNVVACERGDTCGCAQAGTLIGCNKADRPRAVTYYARACELGDLEACTFAGPIYLYGVDVPRDVERGLGYLNRACAGKAAWGCRKLARQYARGEGVPQDDAQAERLRALACKFGDEESCSLPPRDL